MKKNLWNVVLFGVAAFFVIVGLFGCWQLDLVCSLPIWTMENFMREVLPWIWLPNQTFYVVCFGAIFIGMFVPPVLVFVALWWWQE